MATPALVFLDRFSFTVLAKPRGKERPRFNRGSGSVFTPGKTDVFEQIVRDEWSFSGAVKLEGPVLLVVRAFFTRPKGHFNTRGELNAKGLSALYPTTHPDWDNVGKIVSDALNKFAWDDDKQISVAVVMKEWGFPKVVVHAREIRTTLKIGVRFALQGGE